MVRHVILWKLKEMPAAEQENVKADIKAGLEGLAGQIPGLTEIHVYTKALPSSANADLMLDTTFVDDLGADSLDLFEMVMSLEDTCGVEIPTEDLETMVTVGDVAEYLEQHKN